MRGPRPPASGQDQSRRLSFWARAVLVPVAGIGAALSFRNLYDAAVPTFGRYFAAGFPALIDLLILGATWQYVATAKVGRPMVGWRLTAHAGALATLTLNALASARWQDVPWHIAAPAVWAVLVELTAKQVLGEWQAGHQDRRDSISVSLWLTAPMESARTRLLMMRHGISDAQAARIAVGTQAAAHEALRLAMPERHGRRARKIISRQLRAGSLPPAAILISIGWTRTDSGPYDCRPETILQTVLRGVLEPDTRRRLAEQSPHALTDPQPHLTGAEITDSPDTAEREPNHLSGSPSSGDHGDQENYDGGDQLAGPEEPPQVEDPRPKGTEADAPTTDPAAPAGRSHARATHRRRLLDAVAIVRVRPDLTGPDLRRQLAAKGWSVSDRTAARILLKARTESANQPGGLAAGVGALMVTPAAIAGEHR